VSEYFRILWVYFYNFELQVNLLLGHI
jgi:hypothetical protein